MVGSRGLVAAVLTMCLSGGVAESAAAGSPSEASWVSSANAICAQANAKVRAMPVVSASNALAETEAVLRIGTAQSSRLAALPRPAGAARSMIASLIALSRQGASLIRQLIPAVRRDDSAAITRLTATAAKLNARVNALARRLGAHVCAENPAPSG